MVMPKKDPEKKTCLQCGSKMTQPRWKNGKLDSTFHERKYCSRSCAGKREEIGTSGGRRRAQKMIAALQCEMCGGTRIPQRHHKDGNPLNNATENLIVLCQDCHKEIHVLNNTWGRGRVRQSVCKICGSVFQPKRNRNNKLCGRVECRKENGHRSAGLRYEKKTE